MPFVRCRFYDPDTGAPLNGGCRKREQCDFVHPSDQPQWDNAPNPRTPYNPAMHRGRVQADGHRDRKVSQGDSGWPGRSNTGGWGGASPTRAAPSRSNAMPPPTAPRRHSESASSSGWGKGSIGGSAWRTDDDGANEREATTSSSTWNSSTAVNGTWGEPIATTDSWGTPTGGGWGSSLAADSWGEPTGGGWNDTGTSNSTAGPSNPPPSASTIAPARVMPPSPAQQSPAQEKPEDFIWPTSKGKEKGSDGGRTPQFGTNTPQYGFTPRTPRSPNRSPERNPARRPSGATSATHSPTDYLSTAKELRKDADAHRLSSWGVSISIAHAGPEQASASTTKRNPFAFPVYTPAEKVDVLQPAEEEGAVQYADTETGELAYPTRPVSEVHRDLTSKWNDYVHTLSQAIFHSIRLSKLDDDRQKQGDLHSRTKLYHSASLEAVHAKLTQLEKETDAEISKVKRLQDQTIDNLARYPLEGLQAPSDKDPRAEELRSVHEYMDGIKSWKNTIQPLIDQAREIISKAEDVRRRTEENKRIEDEQKTAAAEAEARAEKKAHEAKQPIASTRKAMTDIDAKMVDLEERITNMEFEFDDLRKDAPAIKEAVDQRLIELGYRKAIEPVQLLRMLVEDGEMPFEPPKPPKTNEELTDECDRLEAELTRLNEAVVLGLKQMEELRTRNTTRSRSHYEVRLDSERLCEQFSELSKAHEEHKKLAEQQDREIAQIRAMLERYEAERPSPPPPPPTLDEIKARVAAAVLPEVRGALQDGVAKIMRGIDRVWERQQAEYCEKLFPTIEASLRITQTMTQYMDRHTDTSTMPALLALPSAQSVQH
ncbi:hypothetical protein C8Q80DRAFT_1270761 [Daedaleopsis nitida]|nr:hypothetical protein C8Q80DRAFT_1270761 [Daedaleopsis nitida]